MIETTNGEIKSRCIYSQDKSHRYLLERIWSDDKDKCMASIIMMNPSYADEIKYDYTTMKIINYLIDRKCYKGVYILNLYSIIETESKKLTKAKMKQNKSVNDNYIMEYTKPDKVQKVYKAWGFNSRDEDRAKEIEEILKNNKVESIYQLLDKNNNPIHPSRCTIVGEKEIKIN